MVIGSDLVSVKPLSAPVDKIYYIDYIYVDTLEERRKKLNKIMEIIKEKQQKDEIR
jgi:hypothetical protein